MGLVYNIIVFSLREKKRKKRKIFEENILGLREVEHFVLSTEHSDMQLH